MKCNIEAFMFQISSDESTFDDEDEDVTYNPSKSDDSSVSAEFLLLHFDFNMNLYRNYPVDLLGSFVHHHLLKYLIMKN